MNSTSSSECNCNGPFGFGTAFPNILGNPFYSTTRPPLIYYAKIEEPFQQQSNKDKIQDQSNCFKKAFQWYTQERQSGHKKENISFNENNTDFATWLDKKYNEYLIGSHRGSQLFLKQSPIFESDKTSKNKRSTRKFGRMRSPWNRHHRTYSKEKGDVPLNTNQSIEYLLQPKDLCKPGSECCQRNARIQSSTTIISKESPKCTKVKVKSKSLLSIYQAEGECETVEPKTKSLSKRACECLRRDTGTQYEFLSLETLMKPRDYNTKAQRVEGTNVSHVITQRYTKNNNSRSHVLCQCSEVFLNEADGTLPLNKHGKPDGHLNEEGSKKDDPLSKQGCATKDAKTTVLFTEAPYGDVSKIQNCSAQTSDHSIDFGDLFYKQPLLLKVIQVQK